MYSYFESYLNSTHERQITKGIYPTAYGNKIRIYPAAYGNKISILDKQEL